MESTSTKNKVSIGVKCLIGFIGTISVGAILMSAFMAINGYMSNCAVGDDVCLEKQLLSYRAMLIEEDNRHKETRGKLEDMANALKPMFSTGYTTKQAQEGKMENVDPKLQDAFKSKLTFIPQALADTSTQEEIPAQNSTINTSSGRYTRVLAKLGSPFAEVPIDTYCTEAGITISFCDVLVGISYQESQVGKDFTSVKFGKQKAIEMGKAIYFNPVGKTDVKNFRKIAGVVKKVPDSNGFYLRKFESWDAFWRWFPRDMKENGRDKLSINRLSCVHVLGPNAKCDRVKNWIDGVNTFLSIFNKSKI